MADVDINPFGEHESRTEARPEEPTDEHIPLDPVTPVGGRINLGTRLRRARNIIWRKRISQNQTHERLC